MLLLDTGVLVGGAFGAERDETVAVCALSFAELEFGLSAAATRSDAAEVRRRSTRLSALRSTFGDGLPFDGAAAIAYGRVTAAVLRAGRSPRARTVDLLIAAVAVSRGASLLTTQPREFAGLDGLLHVRGVGGADQRRSWDPHGLRGVPLSA